MENQTLKTDVIFDAPAAKVWQGLTDPIVVKQYFFGTDVKSDWKAGSAITFSGEWEGKAYGDKGIIIEIEYAKILKYSYWSSMAGLKDTPPNYVSITYELTAVNGKTILAITQEGICGTDAIAKQEQNWHTVFEGLKKLL